MPMAQLMMGKAPASQEIHRSRGPAEGAPGGFAQAAKSLASDEPATESASSSEGADDEGSCLPTTSCSSCKPPAPDVSLVVPPTSPAPGR